MHGERLSVLKSDPIFFRLWHKGITKARLIHRNKMYGFTLCYDLLNNLTFCQVIVQAECLPAAALLHCKLTEVLLYSQSAMNFCCVSTVDSFLLDSHAYMQN